MSRAHLEIRSIGGRVYIIDRESRNGVAIRPAGKTKWTRLTPWKPVVWLPGMSVRIGSRILRLEANTPQAVIAGPPSSSPTVRIPVAAGSERNAS
jgi:hypothetical protein